MPIEMPTTREGILALYEEVKPELAQFLADSASPTANAFGMARARELEYTLKSGGIPADLVKFTEENIKRIKDSKGLGAIGIYVDEPTYAKYIAMNWQWPFNLGEKMATLRDALKEYKGADKEEILTQPVHGDNLTGLGLRAARAAYKWVPEFVSGYVRSGAKTLDSYMSHTLKQAVDMYDKVVLKGRKISEVSGESMESASTTEPQPAVAIPRGTISESATDSLYSPSSIGGESEAVVSAAGSMSSVSPGLHGGAAKPKMSDEEAATIKIQAAYRGYKARKDFVSPKVVAFGAGESEAVSVPAAVRKTRQYNEIKALQTQFNTNAKRGDYKLLRPSVDLLIKADPANTLKFIQSCIDKKLGGEDFNKHLTEELQHAKAKISAMQDRAKMDARAKKLMER